MVTRALRRAVCFVTTALAGVALSSATMAVTPSDVSFQNQQGVTISAKLYRPLGEGRFPAVVMLHGCSGIFSLSDPTRGVASIYREWADRLTAAGYVALLVDSFTARAAAQNQCGNGAAGTSEVTERPYDALAAHGFLRKRAFVRSLRIGVLGWSQGGSTVLATVDKTVSPTRLFKAAIAFYPGCGLYDAFGGLQDSTWAPITPTRILHASRDPLFSSGSCRLRVQNAMALGNVPITMRAYVGAQHSFDQATAVTGKWTAADVAAKTSADALAMQMLARRLQRQGSVRSAAATSKH